MNIFSRTEALIGIDAMEKIKKSKVAIVGLGGVGGAVCEGLVRAGIGTLILVDNDVINLTNLNRQIVANTANIGVSKVEAAGDRALSINPKVNIIGLNILVNAQNTRLLFEEKPDYLVDAIDTVSAKISIVEYANSTKTRMVSCLSTGNRLDGSRFRFGDIRDTVGSGCPLARVMRRELRKRGISSLNVLYSDAAFSRVVVDAVNGRHAPASISYVPPIAGYLLVQKVITDIINS